MIISLSILETRKMIDSPEYEELDYDETGLDEAAPQPGPSQVEEASGKKKKKKGIACPVCQQDCARKLKRHALREHLPPFLVPNPTCMCCGFVGATPQDSLDHHFACLHSESGPSGQLWVAKTRGFLERLRVAFGAPDLESLLEMYSSTFGTSVYAGESLDLGDMERFLFELLGVDLSTASLSPPNHPAVLSHWKLALRLLSLLPAEKREQVVEDTSGIESSGLLAVADSHFHLDSLLQYSGLDTLEQVGDFCKGKIPELGGFVVPLAVANFCWA